MTIVRAAPAESVPESAYAWLRLAASLAVMTVSGVGMYAVAVALPVIQAEFGIDRSDASLPYTATMVGFGLGGILMGRLSDRFGVMVPVILGAAGLGLGFVAAGHASNLWQFALAQGLLIGLLGTSAGFAPLVADTSLWFTRRRGIAVAICASGNYLAGAAWPTSRARRCSCCSASRAWPAASRCPCPRCTSSPTAATSASRPRAARRCCRSCSAPAS
jgi:MFS family permease